jgi:hypothetical protein
MENHLNQGNELRPNPKPAGQKKAPIQVFFYKLTKIPTIAIAPGMAG